MTRSIDPPLHPPDYVDVVQGVNLKLMRLYVDMTLLPDVQREAVMYSVRCRNYEAIDIVVRSLEKALGPIVDNFS